MFKVLLHLNFSVKSLQQMRRRIHLAQRSGLFHVKRAHSGKFQASLSDHFFLLFTHRVGRCGSCATCWIGEHIVTRADDTDDTVSTSRSFGCRVSVTHLCHHEFECLKKKRKLSVDVNSTEGDKKAASDTRRRNCRRRDGKRKTG